MKRGSWRNDTPLDAKRRFARAHQAASSRAISASCAAESFELVDLCLGQEECSIVGRIFDLSDSTFVHGSVGVFLASIAFFVVGARACRCSRRLQARKHQAHRSARSCSVGQAFSQLGKRKTVRFDVDGEAESALAHRPGRPSTLPALAFTSDQDELRVIRSMRTNDQRFEDAEFRDARGKLGETGGDKGALRGRARRGS
jgi:hypothetical protein